MTGLKMGVAIGWEITSSMVAIAGGFSDGIVMAGTTLAGVGVGVGEGDGDYDNGGVATVVDKEFSCHYLLFNFVVSTLGLIVLSI